MGSPPKNLITLKLLDFVKSQQVTEMTSEQVYQRGPMKGHLKPIKEQGRGNRRSTSVWAEKATEADVLKELENGRDLDETFTDLVIYKKVSLLKTLYGKLPDDLKKDKDFQNEVICFADGDEETMKEMISWNWSGVSSELKEALDEMDVVCCCCQCSCGCSKESGCQCTGSSCGC